MTRNSPDELQSGQERWQSLLDNLQVAPADILKVSIKGGQELDEVLGLGLVLLELLRLCHVVVILEAVLLLGVGLHDLNDFLDLRLGQLLVESVESGGSLAPVLGLSRGSLGVLLPRVFLINGLLDCVGPVFKGINEILNDGLIICKIFDLSVFRQLWNFN